VILDPRAIPPGLADSKTLTAEARERLWPVIMETALCVSFASSSARSIDRLNIRAATLGAMSRAVAGLSVAPARVLVDGRDVFPAACPVTPIIGGDASEPAIAAASIVAKVLRDRLMARLDAAWPLYGFAAHAGYGTPRHRDAILLLGPCPEHRFSFAPVKGRWTR
jgi:ribonuclease HII